MPVIQCNPNSDAKIYFASKILVPISFRGKADHTDMCEIMQDLCSQARQSCQPLIPAPAIARLLSFACVLCKVCKRYWHMFYILQELSMLLVNQMVLLSGAGTKSQCLQKMTEVEIWSDSLSSSDLKLKLIFIFFSSQK